jgi:hypothetical protein
MPPSECEDELFGIEEENSLLVQAERVARGYARGKSRQRDAAFVDECIAEAYFTVVELLWTSLKEIKEKYPDIVERHKFIRMSIGYKLKEYWAYRATSTISFLKKRGIVVKHQSIETCQVISDDSSLNEFIALDHATRDQVERRVIEFYCMGNDLELISIKCSMSQKRVKKILIRVKKRLLRANLPTI